MSSCEALNGLFVERAAHIKLAFFFAWWLFYSCGKSNQEYKKKKNNPESNDCGTDDVETGEQECLKCLPSG